MCLLDRAPWGKMLQLIELLRVNPPRRGIGHHITVAPTDPGTPYPPIIKVNEEPCAGTHLTSMVLSMMILNPCHSLDDVDRVMNLSLSSLSIYSQTGIVCLSMVPKEQPLAWRTPDPVFSIDNRFNYNTLTVLIAKK